LAHILAFPGENSKPPQVPDQDSYPSSNATGIAQVYFPLACAILFSANLRSKRVFKTLSATKYQNVIEQIISLFLLILQTIFGNRYLVF